MQKTIYTLYSFIVFSNLLFVDLSSYSVLAFAYKKKTNKTLSARSRTQVSFLDKTQTRNPLS